MTALLEEVALQLRLLVLTEFMEVAEVAVRLPDLGQLEVLRPMAGLAGRAMVPPTERLALVLLRAVVAVVLAAVAHRFLGLALLAA